MATSNIPPFSAHFKPDGEKFSFLLVVALVTWR